jgi:hypothetical protein
VLCFGSISLRYVPYRIVARFVLLFNFGQTRSESFFTLPQSDRLGLRIGKNRKSYYVVRSDTYNEAYNHNGRSTGYNQPIN